MLKVMVVNRREIPVPVPIRTLGAALEWLEETLVERGQVVTQIVLDDQEMPYDTLKKLTDRALDEGSRLEVTVDSPDRLSLGVLEAVKSLAEQHLSAIKIVSVGLWQHRGLGAPPDLKVLRDDANMMLELIDHAAGIIDYSHADMAPLCANGRLLRVVLGRLDEALALGQWQICAKVLLNRMEPLLKTIAFEIDPLMVKVMTAAGRDASQADVGQVST